MSIKSISPYIAALGPAIQLGYGINQIIEANRLKRTPQPPYQIAPSATMARNMAVSRAGMYGYPGMAQDISRVYRSMSNIMSERGQSGLSGSQKMNLLGALVPKTQQQIADIGAMSAREKAANERQAQSMLMAYAPYETKKFETDIMKSFYDKEKAAAALLQAGPTNLFDFSKNLSEIFSKWPTDQK